MFIYKYHIMSEAGRYSTGSKYPASTLGGRLTDDHIAMCKDLTRAVKAGTELQIVNLLMKYRPSIKALLQIDTEISIADNYACTIVHLIYSKDYWNAYELLISFFKTPLSKGFIHKQTTKNLFPIGLAERNSEILKYSLFGCRDVVLSVHLDMHLDAILNSNLQEELGEHYAKTYVNTILQLACIYGNEETMTNAFGFQRHAQNVDKTAKTNELVSAHMLDILAQVGGNDLSTVRATRLNVVGPLNIISKLQSAALLDSTSAVLGAVKQVLLSMDSAPYDATGAKLIALVRVCTSLHASNKLIKHAEEAFVDVTLSLNLDTILYMHSVLKTLLKIDPALASKVSFLAYMSVLYNCPEYALTLAVCNPLHEIFIGRNGWYEEDDLLSKVVQNTFCKVQFADGYPLLELWYKVHTGVDISKAKGFMLQSLKHCLSESLFKSIVHQAAVLKSTASLSGLLPVARVSSYGNITRSYISVTDFVDFMSIPAKKRDEEDEEDDEDEDKEDEEEKKKKTKNRGDVRTLEEAACQCLNYNLPLSHCIEYLQVVAEQASGNRMFSMAGYDFITLFFQLHFETFERDIQQLRQVTKTLGLGILKRPNPFTKSLHELFCNSTLAVDYVKEMSTSVNSIPYSYTTLTNGLLQAVLRCVTSHTTRRHALELVTLLNSQHIGDYAQDIVAIIFHTILAAVIQSRYPKILLYMLDATKPSRMDTDGGVNFEMSTQNYVSEEGVTDYTQLSSANESVMTVLPTHCEDYTIVIRLERPWFQFPRLKLFAELFLDACVGSMIGYLMHSAGHAKGEGTIFDKNTQLPVLNKYIRMLTAKIGQGDERLALKYRIVLYLYTAIALVYCHSVRLRTDLPDDLKSLIEDRDTSYPDNTGVDERELAFIDSYMFFLLTTLAEDHSSDEESSKYVKDMLEKIICEYMGMRVYASPLFQYRNMLLTTTRKYPMNILSSTLSGAGCNNILGHCGNIMETLASNVSSGQVARLSSYDNSLYLNMGTYPTNLMTIPSREFPGMPHQLISEMKANRMSQ